VANMAQKVENVDLIENTSQQFQLVVPRNEEEHEATTRDEQRVQGSASSRSPH